MTGISKSIKDKLYYYFAQKNWGVDREYAPWKDAHYDEHLKAPWKSWWLLIRLNWHYRIKRERSFLLSGTEIEKEGLLYPESKAYYREGIYHLANRLSKFDVVSFDIFDTLIFRPVEHPVDAFFLVEAQNGLVDFVTNRRKAEALAREKTKKKNQEINIFDIYEELKNFYEIDALSEAEREIGVETEICYANPYMHAVYAQLIARGVKVVATSDMYIPEKYMQAILDKCGYEKIEKIYMSCDHELYKRDGSLQKYVQKEQGASLRIVHVDDSIDAIRGCKVAGWETVYYKNCNEIGRPYRLWYLNSPVSQMYKGLVNNYLHCGASHPGKLFEFGFVYGGFLTSSYCEWINKFCRENHCQKIIFLARDMDVFYKAYQRYFSEFPSAYVNVSRNALQELVFDQYPQELISHCLDPRLLQGKTIGTVLEEVDLKFLTQYLHEYGLKENHTFNRAHYARVCRLILKHKDEVCSFFNRPDEAVKSYFQESMGDASKVCVAGFGWVGSETAYIKYLVEDKWKLDCEVVGTLLGSMLTPRSDSLVERGIVTPFVFGPGKNQHLSLQANKNPDEIVRVSLENVFSSPTASLIKYETDENGEVAFVKNAGNPNAHLVNMFQEGVLAFTEQYAKYKHLYAGNFPVGGQDSYEPVFRVLENNDYLIDTLGDFVEMPNVISGYCSEDQYREFKDLCVEEYEFPLPKTFKKISRKSRALLDEVVQTVGSSHDDIYIYKHHIGEIYIYLNLVKYFVKRNQSQSPVLICSEKRYLPLYKMFAAEFPIVYIPLDGASLDAAFFDDITCYKGHRFFAPTPDRFLELRGLICEKSQIAHFYDYIASSMNVSSEEEIRFSKPMIRDEVKRRTLEKAQAIKLNVKKFVAFFPEAVTASGLSMTFWKRMVSLFESNGYDVFVNETSDTYFEIGGKSYQMDMDEIYYLSSISQGVFALVNGLVVSFAMMETPRYFVYTDQTPTIGDRMTSTTMLDAYGLSGIPCCNSDRLFEIDIRKVNEEDLISKIVQDYSLQVEHS